MDAPSTRLIQDRLVNADGSGVSGRLEISWRPGVSRDGFTIAGGKINVQLKRGAFAINLAPGDYMVKYILIDGSQRTENWTVPMGSGPYKIAQVRQ